MSETGNRAGPFPVDKASFLRPAISPNDLAISGVIYQRSDNPLTINLARINFARINASPHETSYPVIASKLNRFYDFSKNNSMRDENSTQLFPRSIVQPIFRSREARGALAGKSTEVFCPRSNAKRKAHDFIGELAHEVRIARVDPGTAPSVGPPANSLSCGSPLTPNDDDARDYGEFSPAAASLIPRSTSTYYRMIVASIYQ